jgi:GT2 family glycosyltransferase
MINVFILNWKSAKETKDCLNSIILSDNNNFRIILINNYSTQSDLIEIRGIYDDFKRKVEILLVENNSNLGYAGGNNEGFRILNIKNLSGDILIVNPDVRIFRNTISEMNKALTGDVGIVTVRTLNTEGKILFDAKKLNGFFQEDIITNGQKISTDYSQGSCMLIKREVLYDAGYFDERFFLYWEEVDFSLRVKKLGRKLIAITTTQIAKRHNTSIRQPDVFYYSVRNARLIKEKHPDIFSDLSYYCYLLVIFLLSVKFILKPRLFLMALSSYFMAIHDSYFNKYYAKGNKHSGNSGKY